MNTYNRLSLEEREETSRMLAQKCSFNNIAKVLNRNISAISREINVGSCNKYIYKATKAQRRAVRNSRKRKKSKYKLGGDLKLKCYVYTKLRLRWFLEQITKTLKKDYPTNMIMQISPEAIYTYPYVLPRGTLKKKAFSLFTAKS